MCVACTRGWRHDQFASYKLQTVNRTCIQIIGVASKNDLQNTFLCKHCNLLPNGLTRGIFSPSLDIEVTREPANSGNLKKNW